ncbi:hypothetical protein Q757_06470 [Oenococcus alcoholitolerans]|uniref:Uncharacterized protein n=1 Tax=Oenococcus alcoholitolerans TaxID=931074 RepID=A0ABR4XQ38_9LACO|nr:hypothetical protein Q757_06470 [Oenococcus alcoholitolerans]
MTKKIYKDYFFDEKAFNTHDGGYVPLERSNKEEKPLAIPPLLKADKVNGNDIYYTVEAQEGESQFLDGHKPNLGI